MPRCVTQLQKMGQVSQCRTKYWARRQINVMRYQGKITNWKNDHGFGFVTPNGGGEKAFVHIKAFSTRSRRPIEGDLITYELATDEKRRFQAENIRFTGKRATSTTSHEKKPFATLFSHFVLFISGFGSTCRQATIRHSWCVFCSKHSYFSCIRYR